MKNFNFVDYTEGILKIRMCRADLDDATLKVEIDKLANTSRKGHRFWLEYCLRLAKEGKPMPWEEGGNA